MEKNFAQIYPGVSLRYEIIQYISQAHCLLIANANANANATNQGMTREEMGCLYLMCGEMSSEEAVFVRDARMPRMRHVRVVITVPQQCVADTTLSLPKRLLSPRPGARSHT